MPIPSHALQPGELVLSCIRPNHTGALCMRRAAVVFCILVLGSASSCRSNKPKQAASQDPSQAQHGQLAGSRQKLNFNLAWRFIKQDVPAAQDPALDDSQWSIVSCPHTFNDIDTFDDLSPGDHVGELDQWQGRTWYRKHFK